MTRESNPMELERKNVFTISKRNFDFGKIREAQVCKETPKTFVIDIYGVKWTYRKSEMQTEFFILAMTLFEAMRTSKMLMERKVQENIECIRKKREENKELSEFCVPCKKYNDSELHCMKWDCEHYSFFSGANGDAQEECLCGGYKPLRRPPQSWFYIEGE